MEINWSTVAAIAGTLFYGMLAVKMFGDPIKRALVQIRALPRIVQLSLSVMAVIATVEAQKSNSPTNRMMMAMRPSHASGQVSSDDIARGYALVATTNDASYSYAMPSNAAYIGNWHIHGAASAFGRHLFELPFEFPCGTNKTAVSKMWYSPNAALRPAPHDAQHEMRAQEGGLFATEGISRFWFLGAEGVATVVWENFHSLEDTNEVVNAAITLFDTGDFITRSNAVAKIYRRINPDDWDGDGLANDIDVAPMAYDGDCFGTGADWLNANCGTVLSAACETNGEIAITWNEGVCANAYYWLEFVSLKSDNRIDIVCDGPSNLGDMTVIAAPNQCCRVPLLAGAIYRITAEYDIASLSSSDPEAVIRPVQPRQRLLSGAASGVDAGRDFEVERSIDHSFSGEYPNYSFTTEPSVGAWLSSVTGGCCSVTVSASNMVWACDADCRCNGFSHAISAVVNWEGYARTVSWSVSCCCQEENKRDPMAWFSLTAPRYLMRGGNTADVYGSFDPPCETNATLTLSCVAGSEKISVVESGVSWQTIRGIGKSGELDDVVFELKLDLDGGIYCKTQALTVACVEELTMTSSVMGESANPPPFPGEMACPFSITNSPSPDRHLVIPFCNVVNTNDFSANDFTVEMELRLDPDVSHLVGDGVVWDVIENTTESGSLTAGRGLTAQFVNPKYGGIVRFRARCDGSPWTEANLVLPLAGAGIDDVLARDMAKADAVAQYLIANFSKRKRQSPNWGRQWFYYNGMGDYLGRVDNPVRPTPWVYNQISDAVKTLGMGAVTTLHGKPIRLAKLSNFMVAYETTKVGVNPVLQWFSQLLGSFNDETAGISWQAGVEVARGSDFTEKTSWMVNESWPLSDIKVRRLWPNPVPASNHISEDISIDYNRNFISPGFLYMENDL